MSDSVRPHRQQPTRLPCPWDSPGKNTGVGCHFLLQCMKVKSEGEVAQSCPSLCDPMDCSPPDSFIHGILQARVLECGAIAFSMLASPNRRTKWKYFLDVAIILIPFFARRGPLHSSTRNNFSEIFSRQYVWYVLEHDLSQTHRLQKAQRTSEAQKTFQGKRRIATQ